MDSHARCWLVVATVAPLVALLSLWSLRTLHAYRRQWRTTDLFFVAAVSQELVNAIFLSGNALINLTGSDLTPLCSLFVWAAVALRTLQLATIASLVLDAALTARWPYKNRLGVRRHQVRYHLVVLATVAAVVGAAAVFAGGGKSGSDAAPVSHLAACLLLPFDLDRSFVLFLLSLQGALALAAVLGALHVQFRSGSSGTLSGAAASAAAPSPTHRPATLLPNPFLVPDTARQSGAVSAVAGATGVGATWPPPMVVVVPSSVSLVREGVGRPFRWRVILTVLATCLMVNHLPYLVMVALARFTELVPPLWLEGGSAYLALVEGLLLPVILWGVDPTYRSSMSQAFVRIAKTGNASSTAYLDKDAASDQASHLGSMSPQLEPSSTYSSVNSYACNDTLDKKVLLANDINWHKDEDYKYGSPFICLDRGDEGDLSCMTSLEPIYCDPAESTTIKGGGGHPDDHIYATLSSRYARATVIQVDGKEAANQTGGDQDDDDDDDNSSVTTSASDDFEFHHMRPPCSTVSRCYDSNISTEIDQRPRNPKGYYRKEIDRSYSMAADKLSSSTSPSQASTLSVKSTEGGTVTAAPPMYFCSPPPNYSPRPPPKYVPKSPNGKRSQLARRLRRNASLSMNDIHLLERLRDEEDTEEIVYVLSGKSESTISLYRIGPEDAAAITNKEQSPRRTSRRSKRQCKDCNVRASQRCFQGCKRSSRHQDALAGGKEEGSAGTKSSRTPPPGHKKHYHRNPKLTRGKLHRSSAFHLGQTSTSNNWSCRPGAFPRQGFPWKQSPTKPFQIPPPTADSTQTSCHLTAYSYGPNVSTKLTNASFNNRQSNRDFIRGGQSYQKKFVSDFL